MERLIGTIMQMVHDELPGTLFSNAAQRSSYGGGGKTKLTVAELQAWLALATPATTARCTSASVVLRPAPWAEKVAEHLRYQAHERPDVDIRAYIGIWSPQECRREVIIV